ncbi:STAS domain-containing protein [Streptomyces sp. NPDC026294]|uniref:STAS domain-containing protein n=1 Tax=Streptomyces sp. NPDC026294 TaxID=3155362 RepID=UPI0033E5744C
MSIRCPVPQGKVRTVRPTGELDLSTARALRDLLRGDEAAPAARLIADLTAVTFMDTSALTELETALARGEADGGWLRLVYHQPAIGRLLRLTGLTRRFPRYATVQDACAGRPARAVAVRSAAASAGSAVRGVGPLHCAWPHAPAWRHEPAGCLAGGRQGAWPKPA